MIEFTDDLQTGVAAIDDQHREIFRRINKLLVDVQDGRGPEVIDETLGYLEEYVLDHFTAEENLQLHYSYPGYVLHKEMHEAFRRDIKAMKDRLVMEGPTPEFILTARRAVVEWLVGHIKKSDKAIGEYIRMRGLI